MHYKRVELKVTNQGVSMSDFKKLRFLVTVNPKTSILTQKIYLTPKQKYCLLSTNRWSITLVELAKYHKLLRISLWSVGQRLSLRFALRFLTEPSPFLKMSKLIAERKSKSQQANF